MVNITVFPSQHFYSKVTQLLTDKYPQLQDVIGTGSSRCNEGQTGDQISVLNRQVEDVKGIMAQNIEKVVERGDRLDSLLEKTQDLEQAGTAFRATAKKVNRHMCLRNARMTIIIGVIVVGVVTLIVLFATGVIKT
ncbi:hypothetical protein ISCGN_014400 [Ixodes scapularis]